MNFLLKILNSFIEWNFNKQTIYLLTGTEGGMAEFLCLIEVAALHTRIVKTICWF